MKNLTPSFVLNSFLNISPHSKACSFGSKRHTGENVILLCLVCYFTSRLVFLNFLFTFNAVVIHLNIYSALTLMLKNKENTS
jgi:hypothetical protein